MKSGAARLLHAAGSTRPAVRGDLRAVEKRSVPFLARRHSLSASTAPATSAGTRRIFAVDAIDIMRAFVGWGLADKSDLQAAIDQATTQRNDRLAKRPVLAERLNKLMATTAVSPSRPSRRSPKAPRRVNFHRPR